MASSPHFAEHFVAELAVAALAVAELAVVRVEGQGVWQEYMVDEGLHSWHNQQ